MISIAEHLLNSFQTSGFLCESFKDPRLYQVYKNLYDKFKYKFKDIFKWKANVAWDKISSDDIEEIECTDIKEINNIFKSARKVVSGKDERPFIVFGIKHENVICIYSPVNKAICITLSSNHDPIWRYQGMDITQAEQFDKLKNCDYLIKIYLDVKNASQLILDRKAARNGSWELTKADHQSKHLEKGVLGQNKGGFDDYTKNTMSFTKSFYGMCERMVREATARWKKIVAENKFKNQDTTKVDSVVKDIMTRFPNVITNITMDPAKYGSDASRQLENIMKMVYDKYSSVRTGSTYKQTGTSALLVKYQQFCQEVIALKTHSSYDTAASFARKNALEKEILDLCTELDDKFKLYDA